MGQLGHDVSLDLLAGADRQFDAERLKLSHPQQCDHPLVDDRPPRLVVAAIEEDTIVGQDVCIEQTVPEETVHPTPTESEDVRVSKLFPNSFKVSGIKHVCDNALSSILTSLPGYPS